MISAELNPPRVSILVALLNNAAVRKILNDDEGRGAAGAGRGAGIAARSRVGKSSIPPLPRDTIVERALTAVRSLPANRLSPEHVAFDLFNRLSMGESRALAAELRRAAESHKWTGRSGFGEEYASAEGLTVLDANFVCICIKSVLVG